jgi:3'(2'), 5'-bisphosphate nucleotidase
MTSAALLFLAIRAAVRAGHVILDIYSKDDIDVEYKADDSPLTLADTRSHRLIVQQLASTGIPILSEEGRNIPPSERRTWKRLWMVDPLDGTKEFIKRRGEFTVNIALIEDQRPVTGVVFAPAKRVLYFAAIGDGAFRLEDAGDLSGLVETAGEDAVAAFEQIRKRSQKLPLDTAVHTPFVIVGSRSHATPELHAFVEEKRRELGEVDFISAGSSIKYCLVAEGRADVYPRLGPTMEWDTAAGQVIAEAAGASMVRYDTGTPMVYNKEVLLNPWHIVTRKRG